MNNAADRKSVRRAEKAQAAAESADLSVIVSIMSTVPGRAWAMRRLAPAFTTPYTSDPHITSFNCGIQNEAIRLMAEIMSACPDDFILAMREQNERNSAAAAGERSINSNGDGRDQGSGDGAVDYSEYRDNEGNPAFDGYPTGPDILDHRDSHGRA